MNPRLIGASVFIAAFAFFWPALKNDWVWEDSARFLENPHYRGFSAANVQWMLTTVTIVHYQPLSWLTHAVDYSIWGMNPWGYHFDSLLFHAANAVVFYWILLLLLKKPWAAAAGALLFALHPMRVECVAWITARHDLVAALFALLATALYLKSVDGGPRWFWGSVGCFAASLLSKTAGLGLPVVLLILDVCPLRRFGRRALLEKLPYVALSLIAGVSSILMAARAPAAASLERHSAPARLAQAAYGLMFYPGKTLLPTDLSPLYPLPMTLDPSEARYLVSALLVVTATVVLIVLRRRCPAGLAAWGAYVVLIFPLLGWTQLGAQITADRYAYLACLPFAALVAAGVAALHPAVAALPLALAGGLGFLSVAQCGIWKDNLTLWTHAVNVTPGPVALAHRGIAHHAKEELDAALLDYSAAIDLGFKHWNPHNSRGAILLRRGEYEDARKDFEAAIRLKPNEARPHVNLGLIRLALGDPAGARAHMDDAIRADPGSADAYLERGKLLEQQGAVDPAYADYSTAIQKRPGFAAAHHRRGLIRHARGDYSGSILDQTRAIEANPAHVDAYFARGLARRFSGSPDVAWEDFNTVLHLAPAHAGSLNERGLLNIARGDREGSIADITEAMRLQPPNADLFSNRAMARSMAGDTDGAITDLYDALRLDPANPEAWMNLAVTWAQVDNHAPALLAMREALKRAPPDWSQRKSAESMLQDLEWKLPR